MNFFELDFFLEKWPAIADFTGSCVRVSSCHSRLSMLAVAIAVAALVRTYVVRTCVPLILTSSSTT